MRELLHALLDTGFGLYRAHASAGSADTFRRATEVAAGLGDPSAEAEARFWEGAALHGAGQLRRALAAMAPALHRRDVDLSDPQVYRAATRYVRVLVDLPAPRHALERALEEIDEGTLRGGHPEWRSRTLLCRARLALSTGEWEEAAQRARRALEQRQGDPWGCTRTSYWWEAVLASTWQGDLERAERWWEAWGGVEGELICQRVARAWLRSCWLRRAGRAGEALEPARRARSEALGETYPERIGSVVELFRVLASLGEVEAAREPLAEALALRGTEHGEHAFVVRVLVADHALARARGLAGLPGLDPEFHHLYPAHRRHRADPLEALRVLARARRGYERLQPRARRIDALLDCSLRAWQLEDRLASVERTRKEVG